MPTYRYIAKDKEGVITEGTTDSESRERLTMSLENQGMTPVSIKDVRRINPFAKLNEITTVPSSIKVMFSKELATLVSAGIPISQSMHILEEQIDNPRMKKSISQIGADIEGGLSLSAAMAKQNKIFPPLYSSMIEAGEVGGILDKTLEKMAEEIEKEHELVAKIRGAMAYPAVIMIAMIFVVVYLLTNVVPQIGKVFTEMGGSLPPTTLFMMNLSDIITKYGVYIAAGIVGFIILVKSVLRKDAKIRYGWHLFLLRLPIFGKLIAKINIARFTRTLGSLLSSGVTVIESLEIAAGTLQNEVFKREILAASEKVKNGSTLAEPLKKAKIFPSIVPQMISVGEETGTMDSILLKVTDFYDKEIDNTVKNLSSLIEPIVMIVIGFGVGIIVISVISPIYQMTTLF